MIINLRLGLADIHHAAKPHALLFSEFAEEPCPDCEEDHDRQHPGEDFGQQ